jgi:uncharacterized cofD-like protein
MESHRAGALRVVAFGGGTGLSALLRGLTWLGGRVQVTAIVAVTDDGGSTGRLRRELGLPAVGDLRRCVSAVAAQDEWTQLLEHRFVNAPSLEGHPLGNLLLAAAHQRTGSLSQSLALLSRLSGARARVLPMADAAVTLSARLADGRTIQGQSVLSRMAGPVERIWLNPEIVVPAAGVLESIQAADLIVFGPGSLFTSVIASTLASGIARALSHSGAMKVLVQNLTTQRGETDGMSVADHVHAVQRHLGPRSVDLAICHRWIGATPTQGLVADARALAKLGVREVAANIATDDGRGRLHDGRRLALTLLRLAVMRGALKIRESSPAVR